MTEDEWYAKGEEHLQNWREFLARYPGELTQNEEDAFLFAWEVAGREMGIVE